MNILCTICMRGNSKGVKNKNIVKIKNKYLFEYTLNLAKKSKKINDIVISTDSNKIINIVKKKHEVFFKRSKKLSNDTISKLDVVKDALLRSEEFYKKKYQYVIDLDVTSPLRNIKDINKCISLIIKNKANNIYSVNISRKNPYFNMVEKKNNTYQLVKKGLNITARQKSPIVYDMNASIYIWKRDFLLKSKNLHSKNTIIYEMPYERSIDIDTYQDLQYVKYLLTNEKI